MLERTEETLETRSVRADDAALPAASGLAAALPDATFRLETWTAERAVSRSVSRARQHLLDEVRADGHWCGELEGDSILETEYLLLLSFLGRDASDPRFAAACRTVRSQQLEEGGWAIYPGGPPDPSPSVKAYLALKLCGDDPDAEHMTRARESIRRMGGIGACNSFTRLWLALFGLWSWDEAPAVPPELILLPRWLPVNVHELSSWSRAIVVPLSVIWAHRPLRPLPLDLDELDLGPQAAPRDGRLTERFAHAFFRAVDRALKAAERRGLLARWRPVALERCERWILARLERSAGLAAIVPAIANAVIALRLQGYDEGHPAVASQLAELEKLELSRDLDDGEGLKLQPCCSPVWDTALTLNALIESGVDPADPRIQEGAAWLLDHEAREPGDWRARVSGVEPGGWYFEYANEFYPDCDDTAEVLFVLGRIAMTDPALERRRREAVARGLAWQLAMQNRDGGWGAFDRECNRRLLTYIPFADHNAMIDPSTVDVTARTVEALVLHLGRDHEAVGRGVAFLLREQEDDGSWYGRWGANYVYGTWLALGALRSARRGESAAAAGARWLLGVRNPDGGWGESLDSYVDPAARGVGATTAVQTSWAMMGLMAAAELLEHGAAGGAAPGVQPGDQDLEELRAEIEVALGAGSELLVATQAEDGVWHDQHWTGTGFPGVFYLRYHYYDRYFPLQALALYGRHRPGARASSAKGDVP